MLVAKRPRDDNVLGRSRESSTFPYSNWTEYSGAKRLKLNSGIKKKSSSTGKRLKLNSGSCYIPKDNIDKPEGEDAHFISDDNCTVGVADGVGAWAIKYGIDAGEYARQLMSNSKTAVHNQLLRQPGSKVDPLKVLKEAFSNTKVDGSSTACVITLAHDKQGLHAANVGDSGFIIIRNGRTVYRSPTQQHRFNCPYQLGNTRDQPTSAEVIKMEIEDGDVIVAGTDGLFDNVFEKDIEETLMKAAFETATEQGGEFMPEEVALKLAGIAHNNSLDVQRASPFQVECEKADIEHQGGKVDDITVIVSLVEQQT